jgi:hypothetical protein
VVTRTALLLQRVEHARRERDVAASVAGLGCVDAVVEPPPHVQPMCFEVDVPQLSPIASLKRSPV